MVQGAGLTSLTQVFHQVALSLLALYALVGLDLMQLVYLQSVEKNLDSHPVDNLQQTCSHKAFKLSLGMETHPNILA